MTQKPLSRTVFTRLCRIVWATVLASGCGLTVGQRSAVEKFSAATADFATLTSSEFIKTRTDVIAMNKLRIQLKDDTASVDQLDEHFTVERVKLRIDAVRALTEYAHLLHALVSTSQTDQLRTAADSFISSIRKIRGVALSDDQAGAIGTAIEQVGGLIVEYMRAKAAREIITSSHPILLQIIDLVRRDFDPKADHWSLGYDKVISALKGAAALAARGSRTEMMAASIGEAQVLAAQNQSRFATVAKEVEVTGIALRDAQVNLHYAIQAREISIGDIDKFTSQVEEFVTVYRILRDK